MTPRELFRAAVHEAGHATAAYHVAGRMGWRPAEMVGPIEFNAEAVAHTEAGAVSVCRELSRDLEAVAVPLREKWRAIEGCGHPFDQARYLREVVHGGRLAGTDIGAWLASREVICVAGFAAVATDAQVNFDWYVGACAPVDGEGDWGNLIEVYRAAGVSSTSARRRIPAAGRAAMALFARARHWAAVTDLAEYVINNDGAKAAAVVTILDSHLAEH